MVNVCDPFFFFFGHHHQVYNDCTSIRITAATSSYNSESAFCMSGVGLSTSDTSFYLILTTVLPWASLPSSTLHRSRARLREIKNLAYVHTASNTQFKPRSPKSVLSILGLYNTGGECRMVSAAKRKK